MLLKKAEMLERAHKQSAYYADNPTPKFASAATTNPSLRNFNEHSKRISAAQNFCRKCYFYGGNYHPEGRSKCPAKDKTCNNCGKIGHFQRVCRSPTKSAVASALSSEIDSLTNENQPEVTKPPQLLSVVAGAPACLSQTVLSVKVNGIELKGLLDTGASESFVNEGIAEIAKLHLEGKPSRVSMASDKLMAPTLGKVCISLKVQGCDSPNVMLGVMPGLCADVVLGQDFLRRHKEVIIKLDGPRDTLLVDNDPFCGVAACNAECDRLFRNLKSDCHPIATKLRKFNQEDKQYIEDEVRKLLKEGVIEPSYSPWRAQVLVARDEHHKPRMVVDYSQTINRYTLLDAYPLPNIDEQIAKIAKGSVFSTLDLKSAYYQIPMHHEDRPYTAFETGGKLYQYTRLPVGVTNGVSFFQRFIDYLIEKYCLCGTYAYLDNITVSGDNTADHDDKLKAL